MSLVLITAKEAADRVRTSEAFILRELRRKRLRGSKTAAGWRIDETDLDKYIEARMNLSKVRPVRRSA